MDLSDFYPPPADLIQSELSVLEYLRANPYMKEHHPQVARSAADYYPRNLGSRSGFEFQTYLDICHAPMVRRNSQLVRGRPEPNLRITLSARIDVKKKAIADVSYCLSVCRLRSWRQTLALTVLRKFHFDVTTGNGKGSAQLQQHPRCHLQYCGEMLPYMAALGCRESQLDQMHPWLSEPRLFYWPMSLALLIDMALHEFPDQRSARFRADNYWRGLVHDQEDLLVRPFFQKCIDVIHKGVNGARTLADAFYVG